MKYCIGCEYLHFDAGESVRYGSTWTGAYGGEDSQFACKRGHWALPIVLEETKQSEIEIKMELAQSCPDFSERPPHSNRPSHE